MKRWYMRDNHTFKSLSSNTETALSEIAAEFDAGYTSGMLCSEDKDGKTVHGKGKELRAEFLNECREWLDKLALNNLGSGI